MPINLAYEWEQTPDHVIVQVNIRGVNRFNMSVTITDSYIKLNSSPHFFDADLSFEISCEESSWKIDPEKVHTLTFTLKKAVTDEEWESLSLNPKDFSKKQIVERRESSLNRYTERLRVAREEKLKQKHKQEQELLEKQWEIDSQKRRDIEKLKLKEKELSTKDLSDWSELVEQSKDHPSDDDLKPRADEKPISSIIAQEKDIFSIQGENEEKKRDVPPVRSEGGTVKLKFTPRTMNTPAREDKDLEMLKKYEVWKANNKKNGENEQNNIWIKARGDRFYGSSNYIAAINAYSACFENRVDTRPGNAFERKVLSNRSACYLMLNDFSSCIRDCSSVLGTYSFPETIRDLDNETLQLLKKCLIRRGTARWRCGELSSALRDYEYVITNLGAGDEDESIIEDFNRMNRELGGDQSKTNEKLFSIKQIADEFLSKEEYDRAAENYTLLIQSTERSVSKSYENDELEKLVVAAYSNRAMCNLHLMKFSECITDSSFVLNYFNTLQEELSDMNRKKKHNLLMKAYTRRGSSYCSIGDYKRAYGDYESASRMAPGDDSILSDMAQISEKLKSSVEAEWLKNRGNFFYKQNNLRSAIHCYTLAIENNRSNPVYYSNRAQCHMKLNDFISCINDCNTALSVLPDEVQREYSDRLTNPRPEKDSQSEKSEIDDIPVNEQLSKTLQLKLYTKRSSAYEMCEDWANSYADTKRALQIEPDNAAFKSKLEYLGTRLSDEK